MKTPLIFGLLFLAFQSFSQSNKFSFGIEYAPAVTNSTHQYWRNNFETGLWPVNNFLIRTEYSLSPKFNLTSGIGLMTAREFYTIDAQGYMEIESIESHRFHNYAFVPLGFKYKFGSFFIIPEIGAGLNVSNPIKNYYTFTDGSETSYKSKDSNIYEVNDFTFPVFLSFGNEIKLKSISVTLGIRSYYGLNTIAPAEQLNGSHVVVGPNGWQSHYYGFGVFGGVSF